MARTRQTVCVTSENINQLPPEVIIRLTPEQAMSLARTATPATTARKPLQVPQSNKRPAEAAPVAAVPPPAKASKPDEKVAEPVSPVVSTAAPPPLPEDHSVLVTAAELVHTYHLMPDVAAILEMYQQLALMTSAGISRLITIPSKPPASLSDQASEKIEKAGNAVAGFLALSIDEKGHYLHRILSKHADMKEVLCNVFPANSVAPAPGILEAKQLQQEYKISGSEAKILEALQRCAMTTQGSRYLTDPLPVSRYASIRQRILAAEDPVTFFFSELPLEDQTYWLHVQPQMLRAKGCVEGLFHLFYESLSNGHDSE